MANRSLTREQKKEMEKVHNYMKLTRQEQDNQNKNHEGHVGDMNPAHNLSMGGKRKHKRKSRKSRRKKRKTRRKVRRRKSHKKRKYRTRRRRRKGGDFSLGFTKEDVRRRNLMQREKQMKRPQSRVPSPKERENQKRREHRKQIRKFNKGANEANEDIRPIEDFRVFG